MFQEAIAVAMDTATVVFRVLVSMYADTEILEIIVVQIVHNIVVSKLGSGHICSVKLCRFGMLRLVSNTLVHGY